MIWYEIVFRLLIAIAVGFVIGIEREYSQHPAGLRTHIMVCLGACVVMITGTCLWRNALAAGGNPDPARLGAQVISGVGFLGAGTIIKDGGSIRGLTTAASLWTVACIGLAAGAGFYMVTLFSTIAAALTLSLLAVFRRGIRQETLLLKITCSDPQKIIRELKELEKHHPVTIGDLHFNEHREHVRLSVCATFKKTAKKADVDEFVFEVGSVEDILGLDVIHTA